jgi:glutamate synthase (NADPH/NADH) large chain
MIALGCKYLRICHLNNCATGVATQDERLRRDHFKGLPNGDELLPLRRRGNVREWLAVLGVRSLDESVGRTDLLEQALHGDPRSTSTSTCRACSSATGRMQPRTASPRLQAPTGRAGRTMVLDTALAGHRPPATRWRVSLTT